MSVFSSILKLLSNKSLTHQFQQIPRKIQQFVKCAKFAWFLMSFCLDGRFLSWLSMVSNVKMMDCTNVRLATRADNSSSPVTFRWAQQAYCLDFFTYRNFFWPIFEGGFGLGLDSVTLDFLGLKMLVCKNDKWLTFYLQKFS